MKKLVPALLIALQTSTSSAAPPILDFKGISTGNSAAVINTSNGWQCNDEERDDPDGMACFKMNETIAGVPVHTAMVTVSKQTIRGIVIAFSIEHMDRVKAALTSKFGQPNGQYSTSWNQGFRTMTLTTREDLGQLIFIDRRTIEERKKREAIDAKSNSADL
ncbi:hypothetical protein P3G55_21940 [Leptospira sp. 96542]|nr:hypothetical protein [Leptospira sp. 96542]